MRIWGGTDIRSDAVMIQRAETATIQLAQLYAPIVDHMREVERVFDGELVCDLPFVADLCDTVRSYRGKMLRPALLLLSGQATGTLTDAHHTLAAVVEMVHMATLVHDDVLDRADERRRQPTVGAIAGNEAAVLLGDFLISHAYHLCSSLGDQYASRSVARATNIVCEGELLQNHFCKRLAIDEAEYFEMILRKTGALTGVACELGAWGSGAEADVVAALGQFGQKAGVAFQIVDDVLDIVGDSAKVGKTLGLDWTLGKMTLPIIHALTHASQDVAADIRASLDAPERAGRDQLRTWLEETGSIDYAVSVARAYTAQALAGLEVLPPSEAKSSLSAMAGFIVVRHF